MDDVVQALSVPAGLAVGAAMVPVVNAYLDELGEYGIKAIRLGWIALPLTTAAVFLAGALEFGATWSLVPIAVAFAALAAVSWADLRAYRIPDRIVFPGLGITMVTALVVDLAQDPSGSFWRAAAGAGIFFGLLLVVWLIAPAGMGPGDVKMALVMGAVIGWVAADVVEVLRVIVLAVLIASILGVALGLLLAGVGRLAGRDLLPDPDAEGEPPPWWKTTFPFGPALAIGTVVGIVVVLG